MDVNQFQIIVQNMMNMVTVQNVIKVTSLFMEDVRNKTPCAKQSIKVLVTVKVAGRDSHLIMVNAWYKAKSLKRYLSRLMFTASRNKMAYASNVQVDTSTINMKHFANLWIPCAKVTTHKMDIVLIVIKVSV